MDQQIKWQQHAAAQLAGAAVGSHPAGAGGQALVKSRLWHIICVLQMLSSSSVEVLRGEGAWGGGTHTPKILVNSSTD